MNIFNEPEDFKVIDDIIRHLGELENGTETTTAILVEEVAPGYDADFLNLSSIDAELRKRAKQEGIALITPVQYRGGSMGKVYNIPFKVVKR